MHATRRMTTAIAAITLVLAGCGQASGGSAGADLDAEANDDHTPTTAGERRDPAGSDATSDHGQAHRGVGGDAGASTSDGPPTDGEIAAAFGAHTGAHTSHAPAGEAREFPTGIVPTRVRIPAIGVDASVGDLSLAGPDPEVPEDFDHVGWYVQTREPGEIGPAVLAGHVDSREGPAVFFDLDELQAGDEIAVTDDAGEERRFTVDDVGQYPKDDLPDEVFGFGEPTPQIRLITCGGSFDRSIGHYRDNVVVYASLTDA